MSVVQLYLVPSADHTHCSARNAYLAVLFQHPQSPHAQSIDLLWLNTTYSIIGAYRDITARIETVLPPPGQRRGNGGSKHGADPVADLRRTLARFRSALVAEDTFYRSLIVRVVAFYRLQDRTQDRLALVGLPIPATAGENSPGLAPPLSREETDKKLSIVYKGLICLGDLERYKEQYSERARREAREGHDASRGSDSADKFSNATTYYEVARGLQPDNGECAHLPHGLTRPRHCLQPARRHRRIPRRQLPLRVPLLSRTGCPAAIP